MTERPSATGGYFYNSPPQPNPADVFLKTLRESLAEYDRRLLAIEKRLEELEARHEPEHFLAPPLPWWARSRDIG